MIFGPSSCLERVGARCFANTHVVEMSIPDSVRELGDDCFERCGALCRVTFGPLSSLERIGALLSGLEPSVLRVQKLKRLLSPMVFVSCVMVASEGTRIFVA